MKWIATSSMEHLNSTQLNSARLTSACVRAMSAAPKVAEGKGDAEGSEEEEKVKGEEEEGVGGVTAVLLLVLLMLRLNASAAFEMASLICSIVFSLSKWKSMSIQSPLS